MFFRNHCAGLISTLLFAIALQAHAETVNDISGFFSPDGRAVTQSSYPTDETSRQILQTQSVAGVNRFQHNRKLTPTDDQPATYPSEMTMTIDATISARFAQSASFSDFTQASPKIL